MTRKRLEERGVSIAALDGSLTARRQVRIVSAKDHGVVFWDKHKSPTNRFTGAELDSVMAKIEASSAKK